MNKMEITTLLQQAHNKYFDLLMKCYPGIPDNSHHTNLGPPELCELAIEVHSCAIALGQSALDRLLYLGLDLLYPFDNPVDHYNWRFQIKSGNIPHTTYAAIAIRIDSEISRIRRIYELGGESIYDNLPVNVVLVSKDRYSAKKVFIQDSNQSAPSESQSNAMIGTFDMAATVDTAAVKKLEELELNTSIWSNVSTVLAFMRSVLVT